MSKDFTFKIRVFPAYAGMSPGQWRAPHVQSRFPRLRGDEPQSKNALLDVY